MEAKTTPRCLPMGGGVLSAHVLYFSNEMSKFAIAFISSNRGGAISSFSSLAPVPFLYSISLLHAFLFSLTSILRSLLSSSFIFSFLSERGSRNK